MYIRSPRTSHIWWNILSHGQHLRFIHCNNFTQITSLWAQSKAKFVQIISNKEEKNNNKEPKKNNQTKQPNMIKSWAVSLVEILTFCFLPEHDSFSYSKRQRGKMTQWYNGISTRQVTQEPTSVIHDWWVIPGRLTSYWRHTDVTIAYHVQNTPPQSSQFISDNTIFVKQQS